MPAQYAAPAWGGPLYHDLDVPSGGTVQVKQITLEDLVEVDLVEEFDKLSSVADEKVVAPAKGRQPQDRQPKKLTKKQQAEKDAAESREWFNSGNLSMLVQLMGRLLPVLVIQPAVASCYRKNEQGTWEKIGPEDREEGVIYLDTVPLDDQMAILSFAMRGMDMEGLRQFREQPAEDLGDVAAVPETPDPAV